MAGKFENILDHQDCISEERMLSYIEGRLSPQEANRVEMHLLECELCSDALEGLRMLHPDKARAITAELNAKIDQRIESTKGAKVLPFGSFYRIAAIFVLVALVGGGYWLMRIGKEEDNIAVNQKSEPAVMKDSTAVQIEAPSGYVSTEEATASVKKEIVTTAPKFSLESKQTQTEKPLASSTTKESKDVSTFKDDVGKAANDVVISQSDSFFTGNEVALSKVENSNVSPQQATNAIEDYHSSQGTLSDAESKKSVMYEKIEMKSEKSKRSSAAAATDESNAFAREADIDQKSLFDRAKSNYDLKKFDLAANDFEKLVKDTTSMYYDDSKWFLANSYMRTNRNSKARKLLQEISNSNSVHKKEAFGLLQEE